MLTTIVVVLSFLQPTTQPLTSPEDVGALGSMLAWAIQYANWRVAVVTAALILVWVARVYGPRWRPWMATKTAGLWLSGVSGVLVAVVNCIISGASVKAIIAGAVTAGLVALGVFAPTKKS